MMEIPQLLWDSDLYHPWEEAFFLILNMNFPCAHRLKPSPNSLPGKAQLFLYNPPNPEPCGKQNCWSAPWPNPQHPTLDPREKTDPVLARLTFTLRRLGLLVNHRPTPSSPGKDWQDPAIAQDH